MKRVSIYLATIKRRKSFTSPGPSDRLYFNRWMKLISDGKLQEGVHYQCVFYGGRLLAHLSGDAPFDGTDPSELVKIFGVNRNAVVLMDSDKEEPDAQIGQTKLRIKEEVESFGGMAWITYGREVENYIPPSSLRRVFPELQEPLGPYQDIQKLLEEIRPGEGKRFERNKVLFAERIVPQILYEDLFGNSAPNLVVDPRGPILWASLRIARWNGISAMWEPAPPCN